MSIKILCVWMGMSFCLWANSQQNADSIKNIGLKEVTIIGKTGLDSKNESKPLSSIDEYMEQNGKINLVKRGNYASEPIINNMASERTSVTIDGMKIFCACTDKMDPVTSYVEITNLSKMQLNSGLAGNPYASNSIGGSLNMKLYKAGFDEKSLTTTIHAGYETNGNYNVLGGGYAYSSPLFYSNSSIFYRKSDNYMAGDKQEIDFSQFEKINLMSNAGFRFSKNRILEGSVIYDVATDVGYPALPMDVKSAKGLITSLSYRKEKLSDVFSGWETKLYFNSIKHIMDDTHRPDVAMHMDMPGKSRTAGFYSILTGSQTRHNYTINFDSYYNQSFAEMTMYPNDASSPPMFMYTWPDIRTLNAGIFLEDKYSLNSNILLLVSSRLAFQRDGIQSDFGYNSMQIYYPDMDRYKNRFIWNVAVKNLYFFDNILVKIGGGYGLRAPSPTESYGYYLYNSFDNYDYLGNPGLKTESSWEGNISVELTHDKSKFSIDASYFYLFNYIIGKPNSTLSSMTINASGVKVYENLHHATIFNIDFNSTQPFLNHFKWMNKASLGLGRDNNNKALPMISPFSYASSLNFSRKRISSAVKVQGAARQYNYSADYGEDQTPGYIIFDASLGYEFRVKKLNPSLKIGVENLLDRSYSTYSDWNNIPRKGRSFYINLILSSF